MQLIEYYRRCGGLIAINANIISSIYYAIGETGLYELYVDQSIGEGDFWTATVCTFYDEMECVNEMERLLDAIKSGESYRLPYHTNI